MHYYRLHCMLRRFNAWEYRVVAVENPSEVDAIAQYIADRDNLVYMYSEEIADPSA